MIMTNTSSCPGLIIPTLSSDLISCAARFDSPGNANTTNIALALRKGDVISRFAEGNDKDSDGWIDPAVVR